MIPDGQRVEAEHNPWAIALTVTPAAHREGFVDTLSVSPSSVRIRFRLATNSESSGLAMQRRYPIQQNLKFSTFSRQRAQQSQPRA